MRYDPPEDGRSGGGEASSSSSSSSAPEPIGLGGGSLLGGDAKGKKKKKKAGRPAQPQPRPHPEADVLGMLGGPDLGAGLRPRGGGGMGSEMEEAMAMLRDPAALNQAMAEMGPMLQQMGLGGGGAPGGRGRGGPGLGAPPGVAGQAENPFAAMMQQMMQPDASGASLMEAMMQGMGPMLEQMQQGGGLGGGGQGGGPPDLGAMMQSIGPMVEQMLGGPGGPSMGGGRPGARPARAPRTSAMTPAAVKALLQEALPADEARAWGEMIIRDGVKMAQEQASAPPQAQAGPRAVGGAPPPDFGALMQQMGPMMESLLGPRPPGGASPTAGLGGRLPQQQQQQLSRQPAARPQMPGGLSGTPLLTNKGKKKGGEAPSVSPELKQMLEGALGVDEAKAWATTIAQDEVRMAQGIGRGASVVRKRRP